MVYVCYACIERLFLLSCTIEIYVYILANKIGIGIRLRTNRGLGLAQSMPGPMFNFAAFLGAVTAGFTGSLVAFVGLFGPGFILIFAMLPFWSRFRHLMWFKAVLNGLNATAVGLMAAGCITLYPKSVRTYADAMVFVLTAALAAIYGVPGEKIILCGAVFGAIFSHGVLNVGQKHFYETM